ncbi:MAG: hemolysin XhlA family protein [Clostridia bacterium]|nr:hemolysin XhlA family protein [Clostridia bacterium]
MNQPCKQKDEVMEKLYDHESRIRDLEINEARISEKIEGLIEKLDNLTNWIKALVLLGMTSLIGFLLWYIQNIRS